MAIADTIKSMQTHTQNAYDKIGEKGGVVPTNKNLENLSSSIESIPAGGDENTTLKQLLDGTIESYDNKKVGADRIVPYGLATYYSSANIRPQLKNIDLTGVKILDSYAIYDNGIIESINIGKDITELGISCFDGVKALLDFDFPMDREIIVDGPLGSSLNFSKVKGWFSRLHLYGNSNNPCQVIDVKCSSTCDITDFQYVNSFNIETLNGLLDLSRVGNLRENPQENIIKIDCSNNSSLSLTKAVYYNIKVPKNINITFFTNDISDSVNSVFHITNTDSIISMTSSNSSTIKTLLETNKIAVPYSLYEDYKTATNWVTFKDEILGWTPENYFSQGDTLPTQYEWYDNYLLTNRVYEVDDVTKIYYCRTLRDGLNGTYNGSLGTITIDGLGLATIDDVSYEYIITNTNTIQLTYNSYLYTLLLDTVNSTYTQLQDGLQGTYSYASGEDLGNLIVDGYGNLTVNSNNISYHYIENKILFTIDSIYYEVTLDTSNYTYISEIKYSLQGTWVGYNMYGTNSRNNANMSRTITIDNNWVMTGSDKGTFSNLNDDGSLTLLRNGTTEQYAFVDKETNTLIFGYRAPSSLTDNYGNDVYIYKKVDSGTSATISYTSNIGTSAEFNKLINITQTGLEPIYLYTQKMKKLFGNVTFEGTFDTPTIIYDSARNQIYPEV